MYRPDPAQPDRRRLEVLGNFKEGPPLGVTLLDGGCDYDFTPPQEPAINSGGRPAEKSVKAAQFIRESLKSQNDQIGNELASECETMHAVSIKTFWRVVDEMEQSGEIVTDGGKGTGKQKVLHLLPDQTAPSPSQPFGHGTKPSAP